MCRTATSSENGYMIAFDQYFRRIEFTSRHLVHENSIYDIFVLFPTSNAVGWSNWKVRIEFRQPLALLRVEVFPRAHDRPAPGPHCRACAIFPCGHAHATTGKMIQNLGTRGEILSMAPLNTWMKLPLLPHSKGRILSRSSLSYRNRNRVGGGDVPKSKTRWRGSRCSAIDSQLKEHRVYKDCWRNISPAPSISRLSRPVVVAHSLAG